MNTLRRLQQNDYARANDDLWSRIPTICHLTTLTNDGSSSRAQRNDQSTTDPVLIPFSWGNLRSFFIFTVRIFSKMVSRDVKKKTQLARGKTWLCVLKGFYDSFRNNVQIDFYEEKNGNIFLSLLGNYDCNDHQIPYIFTLYENKNCISLTVYSSAISFGT